MEWKFPPKNETVKSIRQQQNTKTTPHQDHWWIKLGNQVEQTA